MHKGLKRRQGKGLKVLRIQMRKQNKDRQPSQSTQESKPQFKRGKKLHMILSDEGEKANVEFIKDH